MIHSKASSEGNFRTANKQYRNLTNIYRKIEKGDIDIVVLLELLGHENISVRGWVAAHLLGLGQETERAKIVLQNIASISGKDIEENLEILSAQMTLKEWEKQGYLKF